jgi:hypothetical protein
MKLKQNRYSSIVGHASKRLALAVIATLSGLTLSQPAHASNITVASPVSGTTVSTSVWVRAHTVGCDGLAPVVFGYSIDNNSTLHRGVTKYDIDATKVPFGTGTHTIHFKAWTTNGICPVASTTFKVGGSSSSGGTAAATSSIPSSAIGSANLDGKTWAYERDGAISGSARGSTVYPASTPSWDTARKFYMTYSRRGGVRWHQSFAKDASATHFVYDTYVYITNPSQVGNVEMDMNQVKSDGATVIFGTQCSTYTKTWEYTYVKSGTHWRSSNIPCNPRTWKANTWHHIQIATHRNTNGDVTYDWVNFDGAHHVFYNAKAFSAEKLGWPKGLLLVNFQLDGYNTGSGSITAFVHNFKVFRW